MMFIFHCRRIVLFNGSYEAISSVEAQKEGRGDVTYYRTGRDSFFGSLGYASLFLLRISLEMAGFWGARSVVAAGTYLPEKAGDFR